MRLLNSNLDWHHWFERWEAMQNCYVPQRLYRFDLMLQLADLSREGEVQILDLGCGPGSLAFRALQHCPNACIVAVDFDPVLLAMGQQIAKETTDHIQFVQADIRQANWWTAYDGIFDLVLSATALHWLSAKHLAETYQRIYRVLKPSGWFMNSDHIASDNPETQTRYRRMLQAKQQAAIRAVRGDDWDGYWENLGRELGQLDLQALRNEAEYWEGTDGGQPKQVHITVLRQCSFERVEVHWQDLGEAVMGARKPLVG